IADGSHSTSSSPAEYAVRIPVVQRAAQDAGRPAPVFSARVRVAFGAHEVPYYMLAGTPEQMVGEIRAFADLGVTHMALDFTETNPSKLTALIERFDREVV